MKKIAIERASEHLDLAKSVINELIVDNNVKIYSRAWSAFLSQSSRFYSKIEQGAKKCNVSEAWFGRMKSERKVDPLLSYIHHARNSDEHGLDYVVTETGSSVVGIMVEGESEFHMAADFMVDENGRVHVRNPQTKTPKAFKSVELAEPRMELVSVKDRGILYQPPQIHLGRPIVFNSPPVIAKLAVAYLSTKLEEAKALPEHE